MRRISWDREPVLEPVAGSGKWRLVRGWIVDESGSDFELKRRFVVPAGFETDFASIPRLFWRVAGYPCDKHHRCAALLHDYLYALGGDEADRKTADKIYRAMLEASGLGWRAAYAEYKVVRWFGSGHFHFVSNNGDGEGEKQ